MRPIATTVAALHPLNGFLILFVAIEFTRYAGVTRPRGGSRGVYGGPHADS